MSKIKTKIVWVILCFSLIQLSVNDLQAQQPAVLHGYCLDLNRIPLPGLSVQDSASGASTRTDVNGHFVLAAADHGILYIRAAQRILMRHPYFGYEIGILTMDTTSANLLDDVFVIGYGKSTRRYNLGSVSGVTAKDIALQPISNPLEALQGQVPGLTVVASSGLPGASFRLQIRGQNSLNTLNALDSYDQPLFIINGIPWAAQNANLNQLTSYTSPGNTVGVTVNNPNGGISPFSLLNPGDIESIEVLRDADATSIYGSRGANGVVLITTKQGKQGKPTFSFNGRYGYSYRPKTIEMMGTPEYLSMRRQAYANNGVDPSAVAGNARFAPDLLYFDTTKYTDWQKELFGNNLTYQDGTVALSGGGDYNNYRLSGAFHRQGYLMPGNFHESRYTVSLGLHQDTRDKRLSVDFGASYGYDKNNSSSGVNYLTAMTLDPNFPDLKDENGNLVWNYKGINFGRSNIPANPLSYLKRGYLYSSSNLLSNLKIKYQLMDWLHFSVSAGYSRTETQEFSSTPKSSINPAFTTPSAGDQAISALYAWIVEPLLEYRGKFNKSRWEMLLGGSYQDQNNSTLNVQASNFPNDNLLHSSAAAATVYTYNGSSRYRYNAVFGRINFIQDDTYILNLTGRRDGSSKFGPGKQFGNFGSVGLGWIFSNLSILKASSALSFGKVALTLGSTGSDNIGDYQYLSYWTVSSYQYNNKTSLQPGNLFNPTLRWGVTKKYQVSLDLGFLKDKLLLNVVYYRNNSNNQLITYPLPYLTGFSGVTQNFAALVRNDGWEVQFNAQPLKREKISWSTSLNLTVPHNKLVSWNDVDNSGYGLIYFPGHSLSTQALFNYNGVNPQTGLFEFIKRDGTLTSSTLQGVSDNRLNDRYILKNTDPSFYGGWQNTISIARWSLSLLFDFKKQQGLNYLYQISLTNPGTEKNLPAALHYWQQQGDVTPYQKVSYSASTASGAGLAANYFAQSTGAYSDASFFRCKNLQVSYNLPIKGNKANTGAYQLYMSCQNVFTLTPYKLGDPETQAMYNIPQLRTIVAGINIQL